MASDENLDVVIRARGGREAAAEVAALNRELGVTSKAAANTSASVTAMGKSTERTRSLMGSTIGIALRYAGAYAAIHAATTALGSGFRFDATMESNTVAFQHFLGSAQAANAEVKTLFDIAAKTPFEFTNISDATRRFLAFGFSVSEANKELLIVGDAISGMGGGAAEINRLVLVLGQIKAKGRLQGDELLQLTELGIVGPQQIAAQLGMTTEAFQKAVSANKISSEQAISAINSVLTRTFHGASAEQAKTFTGQLSTIRDYGSQAAGALVKPLFDLAKSGIMPRLSDKLMAIADALNAGGAARFWHDMGMAAKVIGPILALRGAFWLLAKAEAAATAAGAFFTAGLGAQIIASAALIPAVTGLSDVLYLLAAAFEGTWLAALGPVGWIIAGIGLVIAAVTYLYFKWGWFHDAVDTGAKAIWAVLQVIGSGLKFLFVDVIGGVVVNSIIQWSGILWGVLNRVWSVIQSIGGAIGKVGGVIGKVSGIGTILGPKGLHIPGMATGGTIPVGGTALVGERGPELASNTGGGTKITPLGGGGREVVHHQPIQIDGRTIAEIVLSYGETAQARA